MSTPLEKWVLEQAKLTKPDKIYWCDGSDKEAHELIKIGMNQEHIENHQIFYELNQLTYPNSYLHRSHPSDVARTEHLTYVCYPDKETAGPNNNWMSPQEAKRTLTKLFDGSMRGRTMYVLPYMMGHPDSPYAKACVQLTDVTYVAVSMRIMTRMGREVVEKIGNSKNFVKGLHSVGDFDPKRRFIVHFPDEQSVWSIGSGYGGNALLGKKCFSLRIASWMGSKEGWLAEHMVILGIEEPDGKISYLTAAMPSACGKTNLAMLDSSLPGYRAWTLGDDIAWMNIDSEGYLRAINPETGLFGVAPGTSMKTNPNMMKALRKKGFYPTLFTNTALNLDSNEPWWEGMDGSTPRNLVDWQGRQWNKTNNSTAAHPNSRFTVSIYHVPTLSKQFDNPLGIPVSAIIFGGRRSRLKPLVVESFNWQHGVFLGASMGSETTAAAIHQIGILRRDPMAMLPFCGYNMGDYFRHWLNTGKRISHYPKIFTVNWFKTDDDGKFIWPGFGENMRILKWIVDRVHNRVPAKKTPIGFIPYIRDLNIEGLMITEEKLKKLFEVDPRDWLIELEEIKHFFNKFGDRLPWELWHEFDTLVSRLSRMQ